MHGNILARKVAINHTGQVWGDLRLELLQTEEGAFMRGTVTMEEQVTLPGKPEPPKPAVTEEPTAKAEVKAALPARPEPQEPAAKERSAAKPEAKEKKEPAKAAK